MAGINGKARATATPRMSAEDRKWQAKSDMETLTRAREIESDARRHGAALKTAREEAARLQNVIRKGVK